MGGSRAGFRKTFTKINMRVLITEPEDYSPKALAIYRSLGKVTFGKKPSEEIEMLVVRLAYQVDASWFAKMPNLKVLVTPTTGLNHIDMAWVKKRGVKMISLRGHSGFLRQISSTAELALGMMLSLTRNIPWAFLDVKKGRWNRDAWKGVQIKGKTLGILGCGRLGKIMGRYGRALDMRVIGVDPRYTLAAMNSFGIKKVSMGDLFKQADIVSIHVLLDETTRGLVKEEHLKLMKSGSYIVNTARAEIVDEEALFKYLENKNLGGLATDVLWDESGKDGAHFKNSKWLKYAETHSNLLITPHMGGATLEAMRITEDFVAELAKKYIMSKKG